MKVGSIVAVKPHMKQIGLKTEPTRPFVSYGQRVFYAPSGTRMIVIDTMPDVWDWAEGRRTTMMKLVAPDGQVGWCACEQLVPFQ